MRVKISIELPTGERADFSATVNVAQGATLAGDVSDSDLTFGFRGDEKIGRDVRSLLSDLLSDRFHAQKSL